MPPTQPSAKSLSESSLVRPTRALPKWFAPLFYLLLAVVFLWRSTLTSQVFLPAGLLGHIAPYSAAPHADVLPAWNSLRWDGIAQFYPWRYFSSTTVHSGFLPLWNPYQFCGTPFVANSQSAPFYPGNMLFYILPTAHAFGYSAALHLALAGWLLYLFLRRLRCGEAAALLGGVVFAYSAWQINWLQLPTFLATSCWFPLLLRQIHIAFEPRILAISANYDRKPGSHPWLENLLSIAEIGAVIGMMILAGHLQITFYGMLASTLWTLALLFARLRVHIGQGMIVVQAAGRASAVRGLLRCVCGMALGLMLAAPQLLPTLELSRQSHRVGSPSSAGYTAYTEYGLPAADLTMLALPEFFGNDSDPTSPYWGFYTKRMSEDQTLAIRHNAAETALYVGLLPLLLTLFAVVRLFTTRAVRDRRVVFMALLGLLALLLALGTPLNALFYFGIPGFGQSGSPARCLVLWTMACACLSAFGLDVLLSQPPTKRESGIVAGIGALLLAVCLSLTAHSLQTQLPGFNALKVPTLGEAFGRIGLGWLRLAILGGGSLILLLTASQSKTSRSKTSSMQTEQVLQENYDLPSARSSNCVQFSALVIVVLDLFITGIGVNPTSEQSEVYPVTPGIAYLQQHTEHSRIMPLNRRWSLLKPPPAVLPPNGATVYGLRDVQGYDSLLTGQYKAFANQFALPAPDGSLDASPPEVGNMVFFQNPEAALVSTLGADYAVTISTASLRSATFVVPPSSSVYDAANDMAIYPLSNALPRAYVQVSGQNTDTSRIPAVFLTDVATRVVLHTNVPIAGILHLADQNYPGWKAFLDGKPIPLLPQEAQFGSVFRSVAIPAGTHTVEFRFQPASFLVGCYVAFIGVGFLTAVAVLMFALRRRISR